jgi:signal transduction histidine kinase
MPVLRRRSLAVKLPLGIALLLALACVALTLTAFLQVWGSAFDAASARLSSAARQVAALLEPGIRTRVQVLQRVANGVTVRAFLDNGTAQTEAAVLAELSRIAPPTGQTEWRLVDSAGQPLAWTPAWAPGPGEARLPIASPGVGPFRRPAGEDRAFYEITAATLDGDRPRAFLIERRWVTERAPSVDLLARLIDEDARVVIGNGSGDLWTDLARPADPLPPRIVDRLETATVTGQGAVVARGEAVPGTPWIAAVTLPRSSVLAPVRTFLTTALGITLVVVMVGAAAGWVFSRRITGPLRQVTESAETIAAGDLGDTRRHPRGDEVDRLAASFSAMAARVEDARRKLAALVDELEVRVRTRPAALESVNKELEAFSYSVSHDLRAPVRAISGFAAILVEDHGPSLSAEARECVRFIANRSRHMGNLIDDLLAFSRAGRQPMSRHSVDVAGLTARIAEDLQASAPDRNMNLVVGPLPPAHGEPTLVRQVLANLLDNAFKFTRPREAPRVEVGATARNGEPVYFVRDNGVGFDMRYAERLFGVFQRLHSEDQFEGTGVGLAIVQRIVQRHGGRVWADAALDQGATFYFTLPTGAPGNDRSDPS